MRSYVSLLMLWVFVAYTIGPIPQARADMLQLPAPGTMVHLSPDFTPAYLQGLTIHPDNALQFDFLIHRGDEPLSEAAKKEQYTKLVKYFLASLTIPDEDQWVNLSPYEKDHIIKDDFGKTEMGRDLLAQDYLLKQITSSLIYPEDGLGKKFWARVYERAWNEYHTGNVPVNTFNKVWIIPDEAVIYERGNAAYVLRDHLKVMLDEDYLSLKEHKAARNSTHSIGSQVIREIVLPELEREVNQGRNFASLRQVYSGMILAAWYKHALKQSFLSRVYADRSRVKGVDQDPRNNKVIYQKYLEAFKKGVFNYIKDDVDKYTHENVPRKYFSGGMRAFTGVERDPTQLTAGKVAYYDEALPPKVLARIDPAGISGNEMDEVAISLQSSQESPDAAMTSRGLSVVEIKRFVMAALSSKEKLSIEKEQFERWEGQLYTVDQVVRAINLLIQDNSHADSKFQDLQKGKLEVLEHIKTIIEMTQGMILWPHEDSRMRQAAWEKKFKNFRSSHQAVWIEKYLDFSKYDKELSDMVMDLVITMVGQGTFEPKEARSRVLDEFKSMIDAMAFGNRTLAQVLNAAKLTDDMDILNALELVEVVNRYIPHEVPAYPIVVRVFNEAVAAYDRNYQIFKTLKKINGMRPGILFEIYTQVKAGVIKIKSRDFELISTMNREGFFVPDPQDARRVTFKLRPDVVNYLLSAYEKNDPRKGYLLYLFPKPGDAAMTGNVSLNDIRQSVLEILLSARVPDYPEFDRLNKIGKFYSIEDMLKAVNASIQRYRSVPTDKAFQERTETIIETLESIRIYLLTTQNMGIAFYGSLDQREQAWRDKFENKNKLFQRSRQVMWIQKYMKAMRYDAPAYDHISLSSIISDLAVTLVGQQTFWPRGTPSDVMADFIEMAGMDESYIELLGSADLEGDINERNALELMEVLERKSLYGKTGYVFIADIFNEAVNAYERDYQIYRTLNEVKKHYPGMYDRLWKEHTANGALLGVSAPERGAVELMRQNGLFQNGTLTLKPDVVEYIKSATKERLDGSLVLQFLYPGDAAMIAAKPAQISAPGGIDMNSAHLNLEIRRDGRGLILPLDQQDMGRLEGIEGFVPVITAIRPVTALPILNELQQMLSRG